MWVIFKITKVIYLMTREVRKTKDLRWWEALPPTKDSKREIPIEKKWKNGNKEGKDGKKQDGKRPDDGNDRFEASCSQRASGAWLHQRD